MEDFRSLQDEEEVQLRGKRIVNAFVGPLAPQQVNLDAGLVEDILKLKHFGPSSLDAVQVCSRGLVAASLPLLTSDRNTLLL